MKGQRTGRGGKGHGSQPASRYVACSPRRGRSDSSADALAHRMLLGGTVAILSDNARTRSQLACLLQSGGHKIIQRPAGSAQLWRAKGQQRLSLDRLDLLILDVNDHPWIALEALEPVRLRTPDLAVVVLCPASEIDVQLLAYRWGASIVVEVPADDEQLREIVGRLVEHAVSRRRRRRVERILADRARPGRPLIQRRRYRPRGAAPR